MTFRWINAIRVDLPGKPETSLKLELQDLADAAAAEVLANPVLSTAWLNLFDAGLDAHPLDWFVWREGGLGLGKEMRRNFSAVLGRFVARAYLTRRHGVTDFVAISSKKAQLGRFVVTQHDNGDLPDWLALDASGGPVLAEAKGAHTPWDNAPRKWDVGDDGPIGTAERQLMNAYIKTVAGVRVPAKRWAVASRWASVSGPKTPFLVAWDPVEPGDVDPETRQDLAVQVRRAALAELLAGMGLAEAARDVARGEVTDLLDRDAVVLGDSSDKGAPVFAAAMGPFGVVNLAAADLATVRGLAERAEGTVRVFALDQASVRAAAAGEVVKYAERDESAEEVEKYQATIADRAAGSSQIVEARAAFAERAQPIDAEQRDPIYSRAADRRLFRLDEVQAVTRGV